MITIKSGDCRDILQTLHGQSVHCCVTSPPYFGLRDYGIDNQIGLEPTPGAYVAEMVAVFREVRRVLRDDGTLWLNLGDSYSSGGSAPTLRGNGKDEPGGKQAYLNNFAVRPGNHAGFKPKDMLGIPWRVAFALQADGWYLRQDIIWSKPNPMPESVTDRCTKAHEYIFLMSKSVRYFYDAAAIAEPANYPEGHGNVTLDKGYSDTFMRTRGGLHLLGARDTRNKRSVWEVAMKPSGEYGNGAGRNDGNNHPSGGWQSVTRNKRSVWEVATQPFSESHFATFPPALIEPCILAGCPKGGTVLDPFGGAGTTAIVADRLGRDALLIELNPVYAAMAERRIRDDAGMFAEITRA